MSHPPAPSDDFPNFSQSTSSYTPSPPSSLSSESIPNDSSLILNSKDVLVSRLNDLVTRLSSTSSLDEGAVNSIHAQIDAIEGLVRDEEFSESRSPEERGERDGGDEREQSTASSSPGTAHYVDEHDFWNPPLASPSSSSPIPHTLFSKPITSSPTPSKKPKPKTNPMTTARAQELAAQASELASMLATTVSDLQARREESLHIHALLLTRVEAAVSRILYLESHLSSLTSQILALEEQNTRFESQNSKLADIIVSINKHSIEVSHQLEDSEAQVQELREKTREMEEDIAAGESEVRYLRIELQAIEAQSVPPEYQDEGLREGIKSWKREWEDIGLRSRERKGKYGNGAGSGESGLGRSVMSLRGSEGRASLRRSVSEK